MVSFNLKTLAISAASLASLPSTAAWTNRIIAPANATLGQNINVTIETSIYIQNNNEFGIAWGLATPEVANYTGSIGSLIGYTDLSGNTTVVPDSGNYTIKVALPDNIQGPMVLTAAIPTLVGVSGFTSIRYFQANITIDAEAEAVPSTVPVFSVVPVPTPMA